MAFYHFFSLVNTQARMELKAEASRFLLSYLWWVMEPLLWVLIFYFVFEVLLQTGRGQYLLFLVCGKIPFLWFQKSVTAASDSIVKNRGLIEQVKVPKFLFPYVSIHAALYKQWAVFLLLFAIVIAKGHYPTFTWLWLLPLIVVQYGLILLCSLMGAFCVCYFRDIKMFIVLAMTFILFSSGIFWDISRIRDIHVRELVMTYNPFAFLIDAYRQILMHNSCYELLHLFVLGGIILIGLLVMHWVMHKASMAISAKVLN